MSVFTSFGDNHQNELATTGHYAENIGNPLTEFKNSDILYIKKEYLEFILEQLSELDEISYIAMMGEYIIYYRSKIIGGIYDDRLLIKPVKSAISLFPNTTFELPYEGAKEMILVEDIDDKHFLTKLFNAMYDDLPIPKKK